MSGETQRTERLHRLLDLARIYKSWTRADLARALKRDPTKLYPDSGNPKLDLLVSLASVLEWSVEAVVEYVWSGDVNDAGSEVNTSFERLDAEACEAHRKGEFARMVELARQMFAAAQTPDERARACNREHGGWDGLGRYTRALDAVRRGLQQGLLPVHRRLQLQTNLANAYYTLWDLSSAHAHSQIVLEYYEQNPPREPLERKNQAFAHYVRGNTFVRLIAREPEDTREYAELARRDLQRAAELYAQLADELGDERLAGIFNTCRGALLEVDVELGQRDAVAAVEEILNGLNSVIEPDAPAAGDRLESYGWWCVHGANIALRHLTGRKLQQAMAVFTNKALEIADRLDNWALRERVFTMQFTLHQVLTDSTGLELDFTIDGDDMRLICGTMGRFPMFRRVGWQIFDTAKVVNEAQGN
jgi:hypothetical protein